MFGHAILLAIIFGQAGDRNFFLDISLVTMVSRYICAPYLDFILTQLIIFSMNIVSRYFCAPALDYLLALLQLVNVWSLKMLANIFAQGVLNIFSLNIVSQFFAHMRLSFYNTVTTANYLIMIYGYQLFLGRQAIMISS